MKKRITFAKLPEILISGFHALIITVLLIVITHSIFAQNDKKATKETKALYNNLIKYRSQGTMIGHQDALAYGLNADSSRWFGDSGRSDFKDFSGEHPAVIGQELGHLEIDADKNLDDVPFDKIKEYAIATYERGGINTLSWHPNNPLDFTKTTWDKVEATIPTILNNKKKLKEYKKTLDKLAVFFKSLKGTDGEYIPVIFRPYHEHTGSWFWWGADYCTPAEYISFWQMTMDHLQKKRKVHNLIIAYSTDNFKSEEHYLERYPGDSYVDILGFDTYHRNAPESNSSFILNAQRMLGTMRKLGFEKNKPWAITETGLERITENNWWTQVLKPIITDNQASYVLFWRNGRPDHYYAPFTGQSSVPDFLKLKNEGNILLEKGVSKLNMYSE